MNSKIIIAAAALGLTSGAAFADISLDFENFAAAGSNFTDMGVVDGTLGSATGAFYLVNEGGNWTYASDLTLLFMDADGNAAVQVGGWTTYAAAKFSWPNGDSRDAGTWVDGGVDVGMDVSGHTMLMGNGYSSGTESTWTGNISLSGIDAAAVPAPGALALLGLAGIASRRRRK